MRWNCNRRPNPVDQFRRLFGIHRVCAADRNQRNVAAHLRCFRRGIGISRYINGFFSDSEQIPNPAAAFRVKGLQPVIRRNRLKFQFPNLMLFASDS